MRRLTLAILFPVVAAAALFGASIASASPDEPAGPGADRRPGLERMHRRHAGRHARRFARRLGLDESQRDLIRALRAETQGIREALAADVRGIREKARSGERTPETRAAARKEARTAVQAAVAKVEPQATRLAGSLTPEQRTRLEERAARHGRSLDEARLVKRLARLLLAPSRR